MSKTLIELAHAIWAWQRETFAHMATIPGALTKLDDETYETIRAWRAFLGQPGDQTLRRIELLDELADVFHLLVQLAGLRGQDRAATVGLQHPGVSCAAPFLYQLGQVRAYAEAGVTVRAFDEWQLTCLSLRCLDEMPAVIAAKFELNRAGRTWPSAPDEDGTFSHIKE